MLAGLEFGWLGFRAAGIAPQPLLAMPAFIGRLAPGRPVAHAATGAAPDSLAPTPAPTTAAPTATPVVATPVPATTPGSGVHIFPTRQQAAAHPVTAAPASPPDNLAYHGGPVMHTTTTYAIYWLPPGATTTATYQPLINRFLGDVGGTPLYNILTQYPDTCCAPLNTSTFGGAWVDTRPYTRAGSLADPLLDTDIQGEVQQALLQNPSWLAPGPNTMYFVFTGSGVNSCYDGTKTMCFGSQYCAYHAFYGTMIYANMPYGASSICVVGTSPNGDVAADSEINLISHELLEAANDPQLSAWYDSSGYEIGDKCAWSFGPLAGDGSDVVLTSHPYIVQTEWSNAESGCALAYPPAASGAISGTVTDNHGTPIAGAYVLANAQSCCGAGSATTAADGTYTITGIPAGSYIVSASASSCPSPPGPPCPSYPAQYYNGVYNYNQAAPVTVTGGVTTPAINFALILGGSIAGTVVDGASAPLAGATVWASSTVCCSYNSAVTAPDGTFVVTGLLPGTYVIQATASSCPPSPPGGACTIYPWRYYNATYDYASATRVTVTSGGLTAAITIPLLAGGAISGTVTDGSSVPIAGAFVWASRTVCCGFGNTVTASDGTYTITGLPPGTYTVQSSATVCPTPSPPPPSPPGGSCTSYPAQTYNNTYNPSAATPVTVASGAVTPAINFALLAGGGISGTVTNDTATPVAGTAVEARSVVCCTVFDTVTASDGTYQVSGLAPGAYTVEALGTICATSPPSPSCAPYVPQYYNGADTSATATAVNVVAALTSPAVNFTLHVPSALHPLPIPMTFTDLRDTTGATLQGGEPQPCGSIGATVWYRIDIPVSPPGYPTLSVDTIGSNFNTAVAVYRADAPGATPLSNSTLLSCKASGSQSMVVFTATAGATYFVQVGGQSGATGQLTLNVSWDSSGDGYTDLMKTRLGRNPNVYCAIMRADVTYDGVVAINDLGKLALVFGQSVPTAPPRYDQDRDGKITIVDIGKQALVFGQKVPACP
ncbi:MAG TPA: carboxypeptidase regulatory-like domain-containing protein [Dehalococcoidia bacterium]|nr:carboxypeptidase regulatory-like domain-containing protein [Dehalococcoidia bacterium]